MHYYKLHYYKWQVCSACTANKPYRHIQYCTTRVEQHGIWEGQQGQFPSHNALQPLCMDPPGGHVTHSTQSVWQQHTATYVNTQPWNCLWWKITWEGHPSQCFHDGEIRLKHHDLSRLVNNRHFQPLESKILRLTVHGNDLNSFQLDFLVQSNQGLLISYFLNEGQTHMKFICETKKSKCYFPGLTVDFLYPFCQS